MSINKINIFLTFNLIIQILAGVIMPGSGLLTWMKGAVSTGGILQRVAEKAKNSVDSMITTLDPQMKEYLSTLTFYCAAYCILMAT